MQADEAADAVVDMDDEIAGGECRELGDEILRALRLASGPDEAITENVLFADNSELARLEAGLEAPDRERAPCRA